MSALRTRTPVMPMPTVRTLRARTAVGVIEDTLALELLATAPVSNMLGQKEETYSYWLIPHRLFLSLLILSDLISLSHSILHCFSLCLRITFSFPRLTVFLSLCVILLVGINPCSSGSHNCDPNAVCSLTRTEFTCRCKAGYSGFGIYGSCDRKQSVDQLSSLCVCVCARAKDHI